jgi:hypothetical protein
MNWNNTCNKTNCGCSVCNPTVSGDYVNGILTINVGGSSAIIPVSQESIETRTPVENTFVKTSGDFVIITDTPISTLPIDVYRNGFLQDSDRYIRDNKTFSFVTSFGSATGSNSPETIKIKFYK